MSKQDTHFFNVFSLVIGLLVAIAIGLFALARIVASHTQDLQVLSEADYAKNVAQRLAPPTQEAIAGHDNTALAIKAPGPAAAGTAEVAIPCPWHALQVCSKSSVPVFGAGAALPAAAVAGALMASAELSWPATASWLGGAIRAATFFA